MARRKFGIVAVAVMAGCALAPLSGSAASSAFTLQRFTLPADAHAGDSLHAELVAQEAPAGVQSATLYLRGPNGQVLAGRMLRLAGSDTLTMDLPLSPNLPPGLWTVSTVELWANDGAMTTLSAGNGLEGSSYTVVIDNAGATLDTQPASLTHLSFSPAQVEAGAKLHVSAQVTPTAAGVDHVYAWLRDAAPDQTATYWQRMLLLYNSATDRWEGTTLAPLLPPGTSTATLWISRVDITTKAGVNRFVYCQPSGSAAAIPDPCTLQVTTPKVNPALLTPATLNLFYPSQDFFAWSQQDSTYVQSLLPRLDAAPDTVQELLAAQVPALGQALAAVMDEVYNDPISHVHIAPPNTTGKYLALTAAIRGRLLLWGEIERRAGRSTTDPLTADQLTQAMTLMQDAFSVTPVESDIYGGVGPLFTQRVLEEIRNSSIPVPAWNLPMRFTDMPLADLTLKPSVIWVAPFSSNALGWHNTWRCGREITLTLPARLPAGVPFSTPIHELGHQFHDIFLGGIGAHRSDRWQEYLTLRGNQSWPGDNAVGHNGLPWENFAEDFAKTFLDPELAPQDDSTYMYPRLQDDPATRDKFRQFVLDLATATPGVMPSLQQPTAALTIAGPGTYQVTGTWLPGKRLDIWLGPTDLTHLLDLPDNDTYLGHAVVGADGTWQMGIPAGGSPLQTVTIIGRQEGLNIYRARFALYRSHLLLDAPPFRTDDTQVHLSGTTDPGANVAAGGQQTTADVSGHFSLSVPLQPGVNRIRTVVTLPDGTQASATSEVASTATGTAAGTPAETATSAPRER